MSPKPKLPSAVYDALIASGNTDVAAGYNRADEAEPAAPVVVVVNVNLNYEMARPDAKYGHPFDLQMISMQAEQVRSQLTQRLRAAA